LSSNAKFYTTLKVPASKVSKLYLIGEKLFIEALYFNSYQWILNGIYYSYLFHHHNSLFYAEIERYFSFYISSRLLMSLVSVPNINILLYVGEIFMKLKKYLKLKDWEKHFECIGFPEILSSSKN
jgi:hypothetical protein